MTNLIRYFIFLTFFQLPDTYWRNYRSNENYKNVRQQIDALKAIIDELYLSNEEVEYFTTAGAYDETPIYEKVLAHSPNADVVIPPASNAVINDNNHSMRNRNIA